MWISSCCLRKHWEVQTRWTSYRKHFVWSSFGNAFPASYHHIFSYKLSLLILQILPIPVRISSKTINNKMSWVLVFSKELCPLPPASQLLSNTYCELGWHYRVARSPGDFTATMRGEYKTIWELNSITVKWLASFRRASVLRGCKSWCSNSHTWATTNPVWKSSLSRTLHNHPIQFPLLSAHFKFHHPFIFPHNYFIYEYLMTVCKKSICKSSFQNMPLSLIILMG